MVDFRLEWPCASPPLVSTAIARPAPVIFNFSRSMEDILAAEFKEDETKRKGRRLQISVHFKRRLLSLLQSLPFSPGKNYNCPRTPLLGLTTPCKRGGGNWERLFHNAVTVRHNTSRLTKWSPLARRVLKIIHCQRPSRVLLLRDCTNW